MPFIKLKQENQFEIKFVINNEKNSKNYETVFEKLVKYVDRFLK